MSGVALSYALAKTSRFYFSISGYGEFAESHTIARVMAG